MEDEWEAEADELARTRTRLAAADDERLRLLQEVSTCARCGASATPSCTAPSRRRRRSRCGSPRRASTRSTSGRRAAPPRRRRSRRSRGRGSVRSNTVHANLLHRLVATAAIVGATRARVRLAGCTSFAAARETKSQRSTGAHSVLIAKWARRTSTRPSPVSASKTSPQFGHAICTRVAAHLPVLQPAHRSSSGTPRSAESMWAPQPAQVNLPQLLHGVFQHIVRCDGRSRGRGAAISKSIERELRTRRGRNFARARRKAGAPRP